MFGDSVDGKMKLNDAGRMTSAEWGALPNRFPAVELDAFIIMPNHVHGIIVITNDNVVGAGLVPALNGTTQNGIIANGTTANRATTRVAPTVGDIVGAYKSITTVLYTRGVTNAGWPPFRGRLWQRNYYEHIIRNEAALNRIRQYIAENPTRWEYDRDNPLAVSPERENTYSTFDRIRCRRRRARLAGKSGLCGSERFCHSCWRTRR